MNKDIVKLEIMLWRRVLQQLFSQNKISHDELLKYHNKCLFDLNHITGRELDIRKLAISDIDKKDEYAQLLKIEANFISAGVVPDSKSDFQAIWVGQLAECVSNSFITENEFYEFSDMIDFKSYFYNEEEMSYIDMILDVVRFSLVNENPSAIDFIENPSFDLLMFVNGVNV